MARPDKARSPQRPISSIVFTGKEKAEGARNIQILKDIVKRGSAAQVRFAAGKTLRVDLFTASAMAAVHGAMKPSNKKIFEGMIGSSGSRFHTMANFSLSKVG